MEVDENRLGGMARWHFLRRGIITCPPRGDPTHAAFVTKDELTDDRHGAVAQYDRVEKH